MIIEDMLTMSQKDLKALHQQLLVRKLIKGEGSLTRSDLAVLREASEELARRAQREAQRRSNLERLHKVGGGSPRPTVATPLEP